MPRPQPSLHAARAAASRRPVSACLRAARAHVVAACLLAAGATAGCATASAAREDGAKAAKPPALAPTAVVLRPGKRFTSVADSAATLADVVCLRTPPDARAVEVTVRLDDPNAELVLHWLGAAASARDDVVGAGQRRASFAHTPTATPETCVAVRARKGRALYTLSWRPLPR